MSAGLDENIDAPQAQVPRTGKPIVHTHVKSLLCPDQQCQPETRDSHTEPVILVTCLQSCWNNSVHSYERGAQRSSRSSYPGGYSDQNGHLRSEWWQHVGLVKFKQIQVNEISNACTFKYIVHTITVTIRTSKRHLKCSYKLWEITLKVQNNYNILSKSIGNHMNKLARWFKHLPSS